MARRTGKEALHTRVVPKKRKDEWLDREEYDAADEYSDAREIQKNLKDIFNGTE
jgi:hypothetical protein